ncbi:hypothetical protein Btru_049491 [Bulinus truncatus]|nr:hypothetical protein Btru_049491 [Bulinus truncatus]
MSSPKKTTWTNPKDIMKIHRIKRHNSIGLSRSNSSSNIQVVRRNSLSDISVNNYNANAPITSKSDGSLTLSQPQNLQKRKNPFSCNVGSLASKRRSVLDYESLCLNSDGETTDSHKLLNSLHHADQMIDDNLPENLGPSTKVPTSIEITPTISKECLNEESIVSDLTVETADKQNTKVSTDPPVDWSLKTKLRIVASCAKDKFEKIPGIDARHIDSFIHHKLDNSSEWSELDVFQKLKRCCLHYSYPHMPWITTFPRMSSDYKSRMSSILSSSEEAMSAVHKDWMNAFTSVYQQFRSGLCPYFYTCTHQFNVLFRCLRTSSGVSLSARLSPSTRGLREMLRKEGIDFRMPNIKIPKVNEAKAEKTGNVIEDTGNVLPNVLMSDSKSDKEHSICISQVNSDTNSLVSDVQNKENVTCEEKKEDSDEDIDDDEGATRWLEVMGFDKKNFPTLEPFKVKLQREGYREIDNRPQSMLYVEGPDVHTFFNFLLNYSAGIAHSGPQHGIPPTILSPVMFVGSTLVQNSVKHSVIQCNKMTTDSGSQSGMSHVFEVSGPVMPHHTLNIASVLRDSQEIISAVLSYSTHAPSAALNTQAVNQEEKDKLTVGLSKLFVDYSLANPGLVKPVREKLASPPILENCEAVRELTVTSEGYTWTC